MKTLTKAVLLTLLVYVAFPQPSQGQVGNNNPTGVTGDSNGSVTTGGYYDPFTGNAKRIIDDITVTGSIGAYPLKWTRILNTREFGGWRHGYQWGLWTRTPTVGYQSPPPYEGPDGKISYPDGRVMELSYDGEPGSYVVQGGGSEPSDRLVPMPGDNYDLIMRDGGRICFRDASGPPLPGHAVSYRATAIVDPFGQITTLTYNADGLWRITEPGGRFLQINHGTPTSVQSFAGLGQPMETVTYVFEQLTFNGIPGSYLTRVEYNDAVARYTYQASNRADAYYGLIKTCDDPRFAGPMKQIEYDYMYWGAGHHFIAYGQILREKNATTHQTVSEVTYPQDVPPGTTPAPQAYRTETRGDDPSIKRHFYYSQFGELTGYTDFANHLSTIGYAYAGIGSPYYKKILTDARLNATTIEKEVIAGAVRTIHHPGDPSTVMVKFEDSDNNNPYYVISKKDENDHYTYYDRLPSGPATNSNVVWRIRYPDGGTEEFTYNNFGQVRTHKMTSGGLEEFTYDLRGLKQTYIVPGTVSDPSPVPTQYFYYDATNIPTGRSDLIDRLRAVRDPLLHWTAYEYNKRGQETRITYHDNTFIQREYNPDGTLAWTADENHPHAGESGHENERTQYLYDEYKRIISVTTPGDPTGTTVTNDYRPNPDPNSWRTHTSTLPYEVRSAMGKTLRNRYDENFRLIETTQAPETQDQATKSYTYDEVGNQITVMQPNGQIGLDAAGPHAIAVYDARNRRIRVTDELGHSTAWEYDYVGNMKKETRADLKFRTWDQYDEMNRVKHTTGFLHEQRSYDYDHAGNLQYRTDDNGAIYQYVYDFQNRKESANYPPDANSGTRLSEQWRYDGAGNPRYYRNTAFQYKHFGYDTRNRPTLSYWNDSDTGTNVRWDIGNWTQTQFDVAGRVEHIYTQGLSENVIVTNSVHYGYDWANHKTSENQTLFQDGTPVTRTVEFLPDDDGNRRTLSVANVAGGYSFNYEYTGRQQLFHINKDGAGAFFEYAYDRSGNLRRRQNVLQGNDSTLFEYDQLNRVTYCWQTGHIGGQDNQTFSITDYDDYDLLNNLKSISRQEDNYKGERFEYDEANQLKKVFYKAEIGPRPKPAADAIIGAVLAIGGEVPQVEAVTKGWNREALAVLQPDPVREPLAIQAIFEPDVVSGPRTVTYTNDAYNRRQMEDVTETNGVVTTTTTTYLPNLMNQYQSVSGHTAPVYDAKFNLTGYNGWIYVYDADNRLVSAATTGHSAFFVYDGLGRCVRRTIDNKVTTFTYDDWKPIVEWNASGGLVAWNLYGRGADEILIRYQFETEGQLEPYYLHYHLDGNGNVQFLLSEENFLLETYTYDVFGKPLITGANGASRAVSRYGNRFMFTGREYIYTLGIYDYRHRHYHPELGRFMQVDPIGFKGDPVNLYRYCGSNPIFHSDPMGLDDVLPPAGMDELGYRAVMNAIKASRNSSDGWGKAQAIVERNGKLRLSTDAKGRPLIGSAEESREYRMVMGRQKEFVYHVEKAPYLEGDKPRGNGHFHKDKTGKETKEFSDKDIKRAREGLWIYKANESSPNRVERLTPQTDGSEPQARLVRPPRDSASAPSAATIDVGLILELAGFMGGTILRPPPPVNLP